MPTVDATQTALAGRSNQGSYDDAREGNSAFNTNNSTSSNVTTVRYILSTGRGGSSYSVTRFYAGFNMSAYQSGTITNLVLKYKPTTSSNANNTARVVKFSGMGGNGTTFSAYSSDEYFDNIDTGTSYSTNITLADSNTQQSIPLNSTAVSNIGTNGALRICIMQQNDFTGIDAGDPTNHFNNFNLQGSDANKVFLEFDFTAAGYGNQVNVVAATNIDEVNGVDSGDIANVISVT